MAYDHVGNDKCKRTLLLLGIIKGAVHPEAALVAHIAHLPHTNSCSVYSLSNLLAQKTCIADESALLLLLAGHPGF